MKRPLAVFVQKLKSLKPTTKAGWIALVSSIASLLLWLSTPASVGTGTAFNATLLVAACANGMVAYRWLKQHFMWRLRNRLIVSYFFMGVIPLILILAMVWLAGFSFAGQFSSFVVTSDLQTELKRIAAINSNVAAQITSGKPPAKGAPLPAFATDPDAPERRVIVFRGGQVLAANGADLFAAPTATTDAPRELTTIALDSGRLHLRALKRVAVGNDIITVVTSEPLSSERLGKIVAGMGTISIYTADTKAAGPDSGVQIRVNGTIFDQGPTITAGKLPDPSTFADRELNHIAILNGVNWNTGTPERLLMSVGTRPSLLYSRLFLNVGEVTQFVVLALTFLAIVFAVIELVALVIGVRLTRTMTNSVAELYEATQHVNRGDFSHRIGVKSQDQLAALETSFNSMTSSLEKLLAEQKEKQRIESELAIAKEVQALLFPRDITELEGLDVHGVCRPARTVSGDYYDFLPVGPTRLGLAVGDISGKGISAALLMATVHAYVRAYTLVEAVPALARVAVGGSPIMPYASQGRRSTDMVSPGTLLAILNQQLYRSTPTEKYATMFLGFYDQTTRRLNYSNAGHLPPLIVSSDGSIRMLDVGGTVVGLFGEMTYPDSSVEMKQDDIFVAYSDGVTEPENAYGEFGVERLSQLVHDNRNQPLDRITEIVITSVMDWIGYEEQPDDVTLVLARAR